MFPNRIVVSDFNRDGIPDIASADGSGSVNILLGTNSGGFQPPAAYPAGQLLGSIAKFDGSAITNGNFDFNSDPRRDLAVADSVGNQIDILYSNGDGTFRAPRTYAGGDYPVDLAITDFNHDGILDAVVVQGHLSSIAVLLGLPQGGFGPPTSYPVSAEAINSSLVVADFNGDGNVDVAVANAGASTAPGHTVSMFLGNGDGTLRAKEDFEIGYQPFAITTADFNNDGKMDLATANYLDGTASVLIGNGDGTFQPKVDYQAGGSLGPIGIVAVKFSTQDNVGLAVSGNTGTFILVSQGDGTFTSGGSYDPPGGRSAFGDFNRDGIADVAVIDRTHGTVGILRGKGKGAFQAAHNLTTGINPNDMVEGDFNEDGKLDFATANTDGNSIGVFLGRGDGTFQSGIEFDGGDLPSSLAVGDVNGDGHLDLVVVNEITPMGSVTVLLGDGRGGFTRTTSYDAGDLPIADTLADFNGDGHLDIAVANFFGGQVSILRGNGNGTFQTAVNYQAGDFPACVVVSDFNGDGKVDLALANRLDGNGSVTVLRGRGDGTFLPGTSTSTGVAPNYIVVADFNSDKKLDMAVANSGEHTVSLLVGNGDGTFTRHADFPVGDDAPWRISAADFNCDGALDLATANAGDGLGNTVSVLLGNGHGNFGPPKTFTAGFDVHTVVVGDFNTDGAPDLAVANSLENSVTILLNTSRKP